MNHQIKTAIPKGMRWNQGGDVGTQHGPPSGPDGVLPIRYAGDFVILVSGSSQDATAERDKLATLLHNGMGLTLSPEKTRITQVTEDFEFPGIASGCVGMNGMAGRRVLKSQRRKPLICATR